MSKNIKLKKDNGKSFSSDHSIDGLERREDRIKINIGRKVVKN